MKGDKLIMKEATKRSIFRWIHIIFGIPIIGYIYDSPTDTPNYAWGIRYVILPVLLISGLWMWKGHVVRRLISKRPPRQEQPLAYADYGLVQNHQAR
jgi:hypothetical protein